MPAARGQATKMLRRCLTAVAAVGSVASGACAPEAGEGRLGVSLSIAPGVTVSAASYLLSGPASYTRSGTVNVSASPQLSVLIGGVPAGSPYTLSFSATLDDGVTPCSGSSPQFAVAAGLATQVTVNIVCGPPTSTSTIINGMRNLCPVIDGLSASPGTAVVGGSIVLSVRAHDPDGVPSPLGYTWAAGAGTLAQPSLPNTLFSCTAPGIAMITVSATDGDCRSTAALAVACVSGADAAAM
jgi:hypothetical protein